MYSIYLQLQLAIGCFILLVQIFQSGTLCKLLWWYYFLPTIYGTVVLSLVVKSPATSPDDVSLVAIMWCLYIVMFT